jgi:hypothetical protein
MVIRVSVVLAFFNLVCFGGASAFCEKISIDKELTLVGWIWIVHRSRRTPRSNSA